MIRERPLSLIRCLRWMGTGHRAIPAPIEAAAPFSKSSLAAFLLVTVLLATACGPHGEVQPPNPSHGELQEPKPRPTVGSKIVFTRSGETGTGPDIFVINADGTGARQITHFTDGAWARDP